MKNGQADSQPKFEFQSAVDLSAVSSLNSPNLGGFVDGLDDDDQPMKEASEGLRQVSPGRVIVEGETDRAAQIRMEDEGAPPVSGEIRRPSRNTSERSFQTKEDRNMTKSVKTPSNDETVDCLNELLRGEIAAVETYDHAISMLTDTRSQADMQECRRSHQERVLRIRKEILLRGAEPASSSGTWGAFAKLVEAGAELISPRQAVHALEAGEDHGLKEYDRVLDKVDPLGRAAVAEELYPLQLHTHRILSALKRDLAASPVARSA